MKVKVWVFMLMAALLIVCCSVSASDEPSKKKAVLLIAEYDKGDLKMNQVSLINGQSPDRNWQPDEGYTCNIIGKNNKILYSFVFARPNRVCADFVEPWGLAGGCRDVEQTTFALIVPYFKEQQCIKICDEDGRIALSADVSNLGKARKPRNT